MRIAILTFHRAFNSGAALQAWALQSVLKSMGHRVEFPACNDVGNYPFKLTALSVPRTGSALRWLVQTIRRACGDLKSYVLRDLFSDARCFERFRRRFAERRCQPSDFASSYDCVIVGSDQVFNPAISGRWTSLFLCEEVPDSVPRIAYAASLGDDMLSDSEWVRLKGALDEFSSVSFREKVLDYKMNLDPTLLLPASAYHGIGSDDRRLRKIRYVFLYTIMATPYELQVARFVARKAGIPLTIMALHDFAPQEGERRVLPNPEAFVSYVRNAEYVVAASFHATAFAINFRKRFVSLRNKANEAWSRPRSLLDQIGLTSRLADPSVSLGETLNRLRADVDESSYRRLAELREDSLGWLSSALEKVRR